MLKSAKHVILGIDEAGKGPVLGDMFVACVGLREEVVERLRGLGVRDSKSLTSHARATLFTKILEVVDIVFVKRYTPSVIDQSN
ncbi:MAG: ribonuclease HII, partial [Zestosphaera sp.]